MLIEGSMQTIFIKKFSFENKLKQDPLNVKFK